MTWEIIWRAPLLSCLKASELLLALSPLQAVIWGKGSTWYFIELDTVSYSCTGCSSGQCLRSSPNYFSPVCSHFPFCGIIHVSQLSSYPLNLTYWRRIIYFLSFLGEYYPDTWHVKCLWKVSCLEHSPAMVFKSYPVTSADEENLVWSWVSTSFGWQQDQAGFCLYNCLSILNNSGDVQSHSYPLFFSELLFNLRSWGRGGANKLVVLNYL